MFIAVFALQTSCQGPSQSFRTRQCLRSTWKGTEVLLSNGTWAWRCGYLPKWPTRCCKATMWAPKNFGAHWKVGDSRVDPVSSGRPAGRVDQPKNACLCLTLSCRLGSHSPHVNGEARRPPWKEARPDDSQEEQTLQEVQRSLGMPTAQRRGSSET